MYRYQTYLDYVIMFNEAILIVYVLYYIREQFLGFRKNGFLKQVYNVWNVMDIGAICGFITMCVHSVKPTLLPPSTSSTSTIVQPQLQR